MIGHQTVRVQGMNKIMVWLEPFVKTSQDRPEKTSRKNGSGRWGEGGSLGWGACLAFSFPSIVSATINSRRSFRRIA